MNISEVIADAKSKRQPDIVDQMLTQGGYAIIGADRDSGKTNEALHLLCQFARKDGGNFHGLQVRPCPALYINFEDNQRKIGSRLEIVKAQYPDMGIEPELLFETGLYLDTTEGVQRFKSILSDYHKADYNVGVVIFDSLKFTCAGNYLQPNKAMEWVKSVKQLAKSLNMAFIFLHHTRKLVYYQGQSENLFNADRLKGAGDLIDHSDTTFLYAVDNRVVAVDRSQKRERQKFDTLVPIRHRNAVVDLKNYPLDLVFDRKRLCWNGQHWQVTGNEVTIVRKEIDNE